MQAASFLNHHINSHKKSPNNRIFTRTGEVPESIGELRNLTQLRLNGNNFSGTTSDCKCSSAKTGLGQTQTASLTTSHTPFHITGVLPLGLIRMKARGCDVSLSGNKGFTLPGNIGELGDDITELDLCSCSLTGRTTSRQRP